jgi:uncharacterized protein YdaU (DUF1376 family)
MAKTDEKADVWMPLYIGDYLADTTRLTTEQHGAYLLLIMDYWRNGPPPDEKIVLQQVTRLTDFLWKKHWPVLQKFFTLIDGHWHHKRIDAEMSEAVAGKAAATEKARKAAEARWGKPDARSIPQADASKVLEESPSPSPSPSPIDNPLGGVVVSGASPRSASDDFIPRNEADWQRYFAEHHGVLLNERSVHDRKKAWPLFSAWAKAGVTARQMDAAIAKAHADTTEPIAFLPAYADRVLASMNAARASPPHHRSYHDERAETIAGLTGRSRSNDDDRTIDVPATRIA